MSNGEEVFIMSYGNIAALVVDDEFRARVRVAMWMMARDILNDGQGVQDGARYDLARQALRLEAPALDRLVWACATNPTIEGAEVSGQAPDGDLAFVVSSVWDEVARG